MRQPERPRVGTAIGSSRWVRTLRRLFPWIAGGQSPAPVLGHDETGQASNPAEAWIVVAARPQRFQILAICALLALAVGLVFGQTVRHEFVNFDDNMYVYENPQVSRGLGAQGIAWVFTHSHGGNWHPLTGLSHMADCQLYGLNAGGHHLTNVLLHAAAAVLLFLVLWRMTGGFWPSALAAAVFAVHPLRVESVAWIAERKDVLSGLLFVLTLGAYVRYVRNPFSLGRYLLLLAVFALGLMAKPMLVTLPLVLLLLDYWPLGRMARAAADGSVAGGERSNRFSVPLRLVREKLPLLLVAVVFCVVTFWLQGNASALNTHLSVWWRITNALVSYVTYLGQLFYPVGLAVFYPYPSGNPPVGKAIGALVVLACISVGVLACGRRCPYLLVGWLWYLGMLVPVIGLVQQGSQARADRFTYLPQIGLYVALAWGAADVCRSWPHRRWVCGAASALVLAVLMGCAWRQTSFWCDSQTLWTHALACTTGNTRAHYNLGVDLADRNRTDEAMAQYRKALEIKPDFAEAHNNLGSALIDQGRFDEAIDHCRKALETQPDNAIIHACLGRALVSGHRFEEAIGHYRKALEINPDYADAYYFLGVALAHLGRLDEAIGRYRKSLEIQPNSAIVHTMLGIALASRGQLDEAVEHYRKSLEIQPHDAETHYNLAFALARLGRLDEAIGHYRKSLEIQPNSAIIHTRLGIALASRGQLDEAVEHYRKSLEIQPRDAETHYNLAFALARLGRLDEAIAHYRKGLDVKPDDAEARYQLGLALQRQGKIDEALAQYRQAVKIKPGYAEARNNLGAALQSRGRIDEAIAEYRKALEIKPDYARVYYNLGTVLAGRGRFDEALAQFRRALEFKPNDADAQNNLAWLLATCPADSLRNGAAAIEHAQRANQLCGGGRADVLNTLAAAYAEAGRFPEAVAAARKALELAAQQNHRDWVDVLRARIALYEAGKPYHQTSSTLHGPKTK